MPARRATLPKEIRPSCRHLPRHAQPANYDLDLAGWMFGEDETELPSEARLVGSPTSRPREFHPRRETSQNNDQR